jgi:hypothetical protein
VSILADRKTSVALELKDGQFKASAAEDSRLIEKLDDKVDKLDRSITRIPPDAAKAAAAMKLLGDEGGRAGAKFDEFGQRTTRLQEVDQRIVKTRGEVRALAEEFNRTGDVHVLERMFGADTELKKLTAFRGRLTKDLGDAGTEGGKEFTKNFSASTQGAASTPGLGPALIAGVVVAAVSAAPLIVSALNAAILAGVGGGGLALGIAGQLHDPGVHKAFADMGNNLLDEFHRATVSFREPLIGSAHIFGDALTGALKSIDFAALSKLVQPLAAGLGGFLSHAMPGINQALVAAGPVLKALADVLPAIGKGVSDMFAAFARGGPGAVEGLRAMALALIGIMRMVGFLVERLSSFFANIVGWASGIAHALQAAFAPLKPVADFFDRVGNWIDMIQNGFDEGGGGVGRALHEMGDAAKSATDQFNALSQEINRTFQGESVLAGQMVQRLFNVLMSVDQATLAWHQSLTQLGDTLTRANHSIDENTAKGQANVQAIYGAVTANMQQYQAMIAAGAGADAAAAAYDANTAALERQLRKAGVTQGEIDKLIGKYRGIPDQVNTNIAMLGIEEAINRLIELQRRLAGLPTNKEINVRTNYYNNVFGSPNSPTSVPHVGPQNRRWGGIAEHAQVGLLREAGMFRPSGPLYAFAEPGTGGEGFVPKNGNYQRSTSLIDQEARWYGGRFVAGGMGGGGTVVHAPITINAGLGTNGTEVGRQIADQLRPFISSSGGNVQVALGRRGQ